jgi:hypothetical protein
MSEHTYHVTVRKIVDATIELRASSPERALQLATNIAAGQKIEHTATAIKTTTSPLPNSVKRVDR